MVRVEIDTERCAGHAQCELISPSYFELRDDGLAYVTRQPTDESDLAELEEAVLHCPTAAITLLRE